MTNLPITSNNTQSPAMGNMVQRNDSSAPSGDTAPISQKNGAVNDQAAEAFAALLARQISEAGLTATMDATQFSVAAKNKIKTVVGDTGLTAKDTQNLPATTANTPSDPAGSLAAMLLQIPVQQTDSSPTNAQASNTSMHQAATLIAESRTSPLTGGSSEVRQKKDNGLQETSGDSPDSSFSSATNTEKVAPIPLSGFTTKHMAITPSTDQPRTSQSNTNSITRETTPAMTHNIMAGNNVSAEIPQTITAPIASSGWADEFSQKIVWMSSQQNQTAELHLNPPDLGPLNVVLKITDNQLTAQFTSSHSSVRDAVENALPRLREILADNNISLGNATVSDQAPRDRSADGFLNQGSGTTPQREESFNRGPSDDPSPVMTQSVPARRHNGILDTFA